MREYKLSKPSFENELLLFQKDDALSGKLFHNIFMDFSKASILVANTDKSFIYVGRVPRNVQKEILQRLGFT